MSELGRAALDLASNGYHVFPCRPRDKRPLTNHGFKDATRDERTILHVWDRTPDANIAIACGASGIVVLDIDSKYGADPREVISDLGLEDAPTTWTGEAPERSEKYPDSLSGERGAQAFFRGDRKTRDTTIAGVQLRGNGAYVVVPPSAHPSGVQYLGNLPPVAELPPVPESVARVLPDPAMEGKRTPTDVWLRMLRNGVPQGSRHESLARIVGHLLRRYVDPELVLELARAINTRACRPRWPISSPRDDGADVSATPIPASR